MSYFETLPVEVMSDILEVLDSPTDLAATIHASPRALAVLRDQRQRIMSSIIHKVLPGEVFKEAYRLLSCPVFEQGDGDLAYDVANRSIHSENWFPLSSPVDPEFPKDTVHLIAVYRTWRVLNTFVPDLVRHTESLLLPKEQQLGLSKSEKPCHGPLTSHESIRMQVAFLRHELMCQLYGLPYSQISSSQRLSFSSAHKDVWTAFLRQISALSLEEIRHIGDYVRLKYNLAFKEICEDAKALLKRGQEQLSRHASDPAPERACTLSSKNGPRFLTHEDLNFHEAAALIKARRRTLNYIRKLTTLGLGFLLNFLKRDRPARRRFITVTFKATHEFNPELLDFLDLIEKFMETELDGVQRSILNREEAEGRTDERSPAWAARWRWRRRLCLEPFDALTSRIEELRKLSWTFWDLDRLKKLGIIEVHSTEDRVRLTGNLQIQEACESQTQPSWILDLDVLLGKVSKQMWEDEFFPQFCTGPQFDKADKRDECCKLLERILRQAEEAQIGKVVPWVD